MTASHNDGKTNNIYGINHPNKDGRKDNDKHINNSAIFMERSETNDTVTQAELNDVLNPLHDYDNYRHLKYQNQNQIQNPNQTQQQQQSLNSYQPVTYDDFNVLNNSALLDDDDEFDENFFYDENYNICNNNNNNINVIDTDLDDIVNDINDSDLYVNFNNLNLSVDLNNTINTPSQQPILSTSPASHHSSHMKKRRRSSVIRRFSVASLKNDTIKIDLNKGSNQVIYDYENDNNDNGSGNGIKVDNGNVGIIQDQSNNFYDQNQCTPPAINTEKPRVKVADYDPITVLGQGAYGKVILVRDLKTSKLFAQKQLKKASILVDRSKNISTLNRTFSEKDIL